MYSRSNRVSSTNQQGLIVSTIFFLYLFIGIVPVKAQELTLDSAINEALASNPGLKANFERVQAARQVGIQRGALPDPKLTYTEFLSQVQTRTGPQDRAVMLSQSAPWPGKLRLARAVADSKAEQAFYMYEAERRNTIGKVSDAYYDYAYLAVAENVASKNRKLLEQLEPVVKERVRAGGNLATSLRVDVEMARVEDQIQTIGQRRPAASARLAAAMGREPSAKLLPYPDFPKEIPILKALNDLQPELGSHPLVEAARRGLIAADQAVELAAKAGKPELSFGVNVIEIGRGGDTAVGAMVGLSLPFSQKKYRAERSEAEALADAAAASIEDVKLELITRLHVAYQAWSENKNRLALYDEKLIPASTQAVELTQESFRTDKSTLTDLIDTERTLLQLELERAEALSNAHRSAIEVRTLVEEPEIDSNK